MYFYFIFHIQVLSWSVFDMQLNVVYSKIGNPVILPNWSCKCCFGIAEIANRQGVFTSFNISREKPAHTPDMLYVHPLSCELEWTNQKHVYCF